VLTEPLATQPRKCLFVYSFTFPQDEILLDFITHILKKPSSLNKHLRGYAPKGSFSDVTHPWKVIRKWQAEEIQKWSIEDEDPKEIIGDGARRVNKELKSWSAEFWRSHPECQQIPKEMFKKETTKHWDRDFGVRIERIVEEYQRQWTERRQTIMMERLEEMDKTKGMRNAEICWENLLRI
jgi:hypothetical protein